MCLVYILFSHNLNKFYTGFTCDDLLDRLRKHISNHKGFTAKAKDWNIVFSFKCDSKSEALRLEKKIKKRGAKRFLVNFRPTAPLRIKMTP